MGNLPEHISDLLNELVRRKISTRVTVEVKDGGIDRVTFEVPKDNVVCLHVRDFRFRVNFDNGNVIDIMQRDNTLTLSIQNDDDPDTVVNFDNFGLSVEENIKDSSVMITLYDKGSSK